MCLISHSHDPKYDEKIKKEFGFSLFKLIYNDSKIFPANNAAEQLLKKYISKKHYKTMKEYIDDLISIERMSQKIKIKNQEIKKDFSAFYTAINPEGGNFHLYEY